MADIKTPMSTQDLLKKKQEEQSQQAIKPITQPARPVGTGFTNVQKLIQGAGQAGQAIAGRVSGVAAQKATEAEKATTEAANVKAAIEAQKLKAPAAGELAKGITGIATGQGEITETPDEAAIRYYTSGQYQKEADKARAEAAQKLATAQGAITELGKTTGALRTEAGLQNLLSNIYKAPSYGAGKQRLDQLILQGAASKELGSLRQQLAERQAATGQLAEQTQLGTTQALSDIQKAGEAGRQLIGSALTGGIESLAGAASSELAAAQIRQNELRDQIAAELKNIKYDEEGNPIISAKLNKLYTEATGQGFTGGSAAYNIFSAPNVLDKLLTQQTLEKAQVISPEEKARMDLLARLSGTKTQFETAAQEGPIKYYQSTLDKAMQDAEQAFLEQAAKETLVGTGKAAFTEKTGLFGTGRETHRTEQTASLNVGDFLKGIIEARQGGGAVEGWGGGMKLPGLSASMEDVGDYLAGRIGLPGAFAGDALNAITRTLDGILSGTGIIQGGNTSADWERITREAQAAAQADVKSKLADYLKRQGFGRRVILEPEKPEQIASMAPKTTLPVTGSLKG
jgi:hypothetical protein